jgi:periplasmic divalent cation tolerance protein
MPTIYITVPEEAAEEIAQTLVAERLAACVNSVTCDSIYRWEGEVQTDAEEILLAKTTDERYPDLRDRVVELHPYEVPCIERFDAADIFAPFADWRNESVDTP